MNANAEPRVSDVYAEALQADRDALNARFAERRLAGQDVDPDAFLAHLATVIDPLVCQVGETLPERIRAVVSGLYSTSLELFAASLLGPEAKVTEIAVVWQRLLPAIPRLVARDPARVAGCLSNAVYNLAAQPGTRPLEWIDRMTEVAARCDDTTMLLDCGCVLAWQAGMVQYRPAALATLRRLDKGLAAELLGRPRDEPPDELSNVFDRLAANPWETPATGRLAGPGETSIRCVRTVGAFRGLGGLFLEPPRVSCVNERFFVSDGHSKWEMLADVYGTLLQRTDPPGISTSRDSDGPTIDAAGNVKWGSQSTQLSELASASSSAYDGTTFAVTLSTSHTLFLIART